MNASQNVRTLFLEEFVKRIIIKSSEHFSKIEKSQPLLDNLDKVSVAPPAINIAKKPETSKETPKVEPKVQSTPAVQAPFAATLPKVPEKPKESPMEQILHPLAPQTAQQMTSRKIEQQQTTSNPAISILDRLSTIINDPFVQLINCPGPDKNIQVTRRGMIQNVPISFSMNEINSFMRELSEKTRIPLLSGLFKVAYQNVIITAVISEFVGTQFMIEKRPSQALQQMPVKAQFA